MTRQHASIKVVSKNIKRDLIMSISLMMSKAKEGIEKVHAKIVDRRYWIVRGRRTSPEWSNAAFLANVWERGSRVQPQR